MFGNISFQDDPFGSLSVMGNEVEIWGETASPSMPRSPYCVFLTSWTNRHLAPAPSPLRYQYNGGLNSVPANRNGSTPSPSENEQKNPSPFLAFNNPPAPQWQGLEMSFFDSTGTGPDFCGSNDFANPSDLSSNSSAVSQHQANQANLNEDLRAGVEFGNLLNQPLGDLDELARDRYRRQQPSGPLWKSGVWHKLEPE